MREGSLPPEAIYHLRDNITDFAVGNKVEQQADTDPDSGPYFDKKLPPGTRLTNVVFLGKCRADVDGWISPKTLPVPRICRLTSTRNL